MNYQSFSKWFKFNNCCTWWFNGWWHNCCCKHDECYKGLLSRKVCDDKFKECVKSKDKCGCFWKIMYIAVRKLGASHYRKKLKKLKKERNKRRKI